MKDLHRNQISLDFWKIMDPNLFSMVFHGKEVQDLEMQEVLGHLPSFENKSVLDLGAGIGRFTGEFAKSAAQVTAVDFAPQMLEKNAADNQRFNQVRYLCSDAMDVSFASAQFDLVFISWLLMYLTDEETALLSQRIVDWMKPDSYLFFRETCAPTARYSKMKDYYARYRPMNYYNQLFDPKLSLQKQDNIRSFEQLEAHPFMCFWLYQKT